MQNENAVVDFLALQLAKREEDRKRQEDQQVLTNRANLGFLLVTWRFILIARAAFFALAGAALQYSFRTLHCSWTQRGLCRYLRRYSVGKLQSLR